MERYSISKSTALRDVQSLEEIGMPIYSKAGRNGYYGILPNRLLSPIVFTIDEVHALYFSMQTLNAYQSTREENFIANYFTIYGETIFSIQPVHLKNLILERLDTMKNHFASI